MKKHKVWIAFGGNIGDTEKYIDKAISMVKTMDMDILKVSPYIKTKPYGYTEQNDFINGALIIETEKSPQEVLKSLQEIEYNLDRVRTIKWGPRTIDLDILFYDDLILKTNELTIPHIEIEKRSFVLEPLNEIDPYKIHPVSKKTISELLTELRLCK